MSDKPSTRDLLIARKAELEAELAELNAKSAPLREQRTKIEETIRPANDEIRRLNGLIKGLEQPAKADLETELGAMNKALSDKVMRIVEGGDADGSV